MNSVDWVDQDLYNRYSLVTFGPKYFFAERRWFVSALHFFELTE